MSEPEITPDAFLSGLDKALEQITVVAPSAESERSSLVHEALDANSGGDYAEKPRGRGRPRKQKPVDAKADYQAVMERVDEKALEKAEKKLHPAPVDTTPVPNPEEVVVENPVYTYDPDLAALLAVPPVAFKEPPDPDYGEDYGDSLLTIPGFITDLVNTTRGMEVPTLFMLWGGLWAVSATLARHAWIEWYPKPLWPNIYCLFVAVPGLCTKTTAIDIAQSVLEKSRDYLPSSIERFEKDLPTFTGKSTGDGILGALEPVSKTFIIPERGSFKTVKRGSKVIFAIGELTTMINKQLYNASLLSVMTALYDCRDKDSELTRARGKQDLEDIYSVFIGATTPDHLKTSMPEEALGGGFISRLVTVYQGIPSKIYSIPRCLPGYPTPDEIAPKLAWIAHTAKGGYRLSDEAFVVYDSEYRRWKQAMIENVRSETAAETRYGVILLKVAMILRAQEYRPGNLIGPEHIKLAMRLLAYTYRSAQDVTEDIGMSNYTRWLNQFRRIIERSGASTRAKIQRTLSSKGCRLQEFDSIVVQLVSEDQITIELDGKPHTSPTRNGREVYSLTASGQLLAARSRSEIEARKGIQNEEVEQHESE